MYLTCTDIILQAYLESSVEKAAGMLFLCTDESRTNVKKWNDKMDKLEVSNQFVTLMLMGTLLE